MSVDPSLIKILSSLAVHDMTLSGIGRDRGALACDELGSNMASSLSFT